MYGNVYLFVHGKLGNKEESLAFAQIANEKGYQVLAIDLPEHGERKESREQLNPWTVVPELQQVMEYIKQHWNHVAVLANSIGAWFTMMALSNAPIEKALFVSPMVNMPRLIQDMMLWANITEEQLQREGEIATAFGETLSWKYYCYTKENPIVWNIPTCVLYAGKDHLMSREIMDQYVKSYHAELTVMEDGEHWFHTEEQLQVMKQWEEAHI